MALEVLTAGAKFHDLTGEDEDDDGGGGLEVNGGLAVEAAQGVWKERRPESGDGAVEIADADPQCRSA